MQADNNQQNTAKLTVDEVKKIVECGNYLMPFSQIAILLDRVGDANLERDFYDEGTSVYQHYRRGDIEFTMNMHRVMSKTLFSAATAADGKGINLEKNALLALEAVRKRNGAILERETRQYQDRFLQ